MFSNLTFRKARPRGCPRSLSLPVFLNTRRADDWIHAFQEGSEEAFNQLHERYRAPVFRYVSARIRDEDTCQDLVQEIFIKVHRFRASYQRQYAFSTWLWTIAKNTVYDHLRSQQSRPASAASLSHDGHSDEEGFRPEELPSTDPCAETLLHAKGERRRLMRTLRSLTRLQRRVLWLRIVHQLSFQEIALQLDLSLSAVKNLAYRAKLALSAAEDSGLLPQFA